MAAYRDFQCPACDEVVADLLCDYGHRPTCPQCWAHDEYVRMDWKPTVRCFSVGTFKTPLVLPIGQGVTVGSLREVRQLERWSEQNARNGEGEQYVCRAFSQEPGNLSQSTLPVPEQRMPARFDKKGRPRIEVKQHQTAPQVELGAGLTGRSALSKDGT